MFTVAFATPLPDARSVADGLTVPTVHRAEKQPVHLPIVPYPWTSQTEKTWPEFSSNWSRSGQMSFAPMGVCGVAKQVHSATGVPGPPPVLARGPLV